VPGTPSIRLASPGDLPAARALVRDAGLPLDGFDEADRVLVAERGGRVIGVAALEEHRDEEGPAFLLRSVAVAPGARGEAVGAALVRTALRSVEQHGAPVALLTETAAGWFPRFGFRAIDRSELPSALDASKELQGACSVGAHALLRPPPPLGL
jgi:amino-acid N-acetyltransferase